MASRFNYRKMTPYRSLSYLVLFVAAVWAVAANFKSFSATVNKAGALIISFDESGLGNSDVSYSATASAAATYACCNRGGNQPSDPKKETATGTIATGTAINPTNGRIRADFTFGPPVATGFGCPGGQTTKLLDVAYVSIFLTDETNGKTQGPTVAAGTATVC